MASEILDLIFDDTTIQIDADTQTSTIIHRNDIASASVLISHDHFIHIHAWLPSGEVFAYEWVHSDSSRRALAHITHYQLAALVTNTPTGIRVQQLDTPLCPEHIHVALGSCHLAWQLHPVQDGLIVFHDALQHRKNGVVLVPAGKYGQWSSVVKTVTCGTS